MQCKSMVVRVGLCGARGTGTQAFVAASRSLICRVETVLQNIVVCMQVPQYR